MVKQKLLDSARDTMRRKDPSYRTEQVYIYWMRKVYRKWLLTAPTKESVTTSRTGGLIRNNKLLMFIRLNRDNCNYFLSFAIISSTSS